MRLTVLVVSLFAVAVCNPPPTTSPHFNSTTEAPATNPTSNETESTGLTPPPTTTGLPNVTVETTVNSTSPADLHDWGNDSFVTNPGLVAILCIFCIILVLTVVVFIMKCFKSPRSNFERLDGVPLNKVSEQSPFAHYSK
ncbi:hypothetical protein JOB18_032966 [Solea senegalensis]|uniref:Uncharacterized protein n=1 Tax=Solea senegalensis TaxID=28829 RepID=A0AAV6SAZ8_SOLSE|nr:hypothetical protein JOB18_032966 [Solea senegalensis]